MHIRPLFMTLWAALLLLIAVPAWSEEALEALAASDAVSPTMGVILAAVGMLVAWVFKLLRSKWKVEEDRVIIDTTKSLWEQKNFLIDNRLIPFAMSTAEHWLLTQLPAIIKDATDGGGFQWGSHWNSMKSYTKVRIIEKFAAENVDILVMVGEKELDNIIDRLLMKLIAKLPDSVQLFLPAEIIDKLTDYASAFAFEKGKDLLGISSPKL